ncbi:MAG: flagellar basal body P-ring formation chaperone FlgA [bacterium]
MINKLLKIIFLTWLFVSLFYGKSLALATIELREEVCLSGEEIFLKDIAKSNDSSLNNIYIGKVPLPGRRRCISQDYVKLRILQAKIKEEDFKLTGANEVEVTTASQKLNIEEVTKITQKYLLDKIKGNRRVEIEPLMTFKSIVLPAGKVEFELSSINNLKLRSQVYIPVDIKVNGTKYQTIRLGFKIREFANVVITDKPLNRHHLLTPLDLKIQEREVTYISPVPLEEVIGKRLKTSVKEGRILTYDLIETPPLINQGDIVTIKKESEFLIVGAKGMAKENGRAGDIIQVKNIDSNKIISGIVEDNKTVVVK